MDDGVFSDTTARADLGVRFVAALIDGALIAVTVAVFTSVLGLDRVRYQGLSTLLGIVYHAVMEGSPTGQTIGKAIMKIRVVDIVTGESIGTRAWLRSLMRVVSGYVLGIGFLWAIWDSERQTWHDKAATSVVVPVSAYPLP